MNDIRTKDLIARFRAPSGKKISLTRQFDPAWLPGDITQEQAAALLRESIERLAKYQDMLYAQNTHGLLIILQAMDAAGKDGVIKHVMTGLNPQGCQVFSFKAPSAEEQDHDYMWRCFKALPERGRIGIFNRSYYEEVLIVRVHPQILEAQSLPPELKGKNIWKQRFTDINNFERYLSNNAIHVVKIFLNVSKEEQKKRFLARIQRPEKNWKFSAGDVKERTHWSKYQRAFEDMISNTSTRHAPWYIVPADNKWFTRFAVARVVYAHMKALNPQYPRIDAEQKRELQEVEKILVQE